jgi:replicative DNA helicase
MNAAMNSSKPFPVAFFSLEMGAGELVKRMLAAQTEVNMDAITKGRMQDHEFIQMQQRMSKLASSPIYLDDQAAINIFELRAKARRLKQRHGIEMIIIDYLQLMSGSSANGGNREQEISKISRDLKSLAKELAIPIIALSQLNRSVESRTTSKVPQLSDLRESGAIEQDADMVIFLYRPEYYGVNNDENGQSIEGETHIYIAKNRSGSTDTVKLKFIKEYQKFVDLETGFNNGFYNARAGISQDPSDFDKSKLYIQDGFQTLQSKANDVAFDDDDFPKDSGLKNNFQEDEDIPF